MPWYCGAAGGWLPGHRGLTPRWEIDVKVECSEIAGLNAPSGMLSYGWSVSITGGGVGLETGATTGGSAKRGSMSSTYDVSPGR